METKFTFWEWWYMVWGFPYLMNKTTGEVHFLPKKTAQCGIDNMARKNKRYLSREKYYRLQAKSLNGKMVNGCTWCNNQNDLE